MFTKGESGNANGRPKGAENKETKKIREWISNFLSNNLDTLNADIKSLEPKDRVKAINDLMEYAVPKLARVENINDNNGQIEISIVDNRNRPEGTPPSPTTDTTGI